MRKQSLCLRVQHGRKGWAGSMAQTVWFNWKSRVTAASQLMLEESFRDRSGFCFWMAAHQSLGLHPRLGQPLVQFLPHGHPIYQQKGKMSLEEAKLPTGIPAICNKYLRCKTLTKQNGVRHESEICLFKLENTVISAMPQCLGAVWVKMWMHLGIMVFAQEMFKGLKSSVSLISHGSQQHWLSVKEQQIVAVLSF